MEIYYCDISALYDENTIAMYEVYISQKRREKMMGLRRLQDKARSLGAELLLRYALQQHGVDETNISFAYGEHKKPYLQGENMPYFNMSHSGDFVVVAVSLTDAVGVDIEEVKQFRDGVAKKVFAENELSYIEQQSNRNMAMYQQWSVKESVIKAMGTGFSLSPQSFSVELWNGGVVSPKQNEKIYYCKVYELPQYAMSICATTKSLPDVAKAVELECIFSFFLHK